MTADAPKVFIRKDGVHLIFDEAMQKKTDPGVIKLWSAKTKVALDYKKDVLKNLEEASDPAALKSVLDAYAKWQAEGGIEVHKNPLESILAKKKVEEAPPEVGKVDPDKTDDDDAEDEEESEERPKNFKRSPAQDEDSGWYYEDDDEEEKTPGFEIT